ERGGVALVAILPADRRDLAQKAEQLSAERLFGRGKAKIHAPAILARRWPARGPMRAPMSAAVCRLRPSLQAPITGVKRCGARAGHRPDLRGTMDDENDKEPYAYDEQPTGDATRREGDDARAGRGAAAAWLLWPPGHSRGRRFPLRRAAALRLDGWRDLGPQHPRPRPPAPERGPRGAGLLRGGRARRGVRLRPLRVRLLRGLPQRDRLRADRSG